MKRKKVQRAGIFWNMLGSGMVAANSVLMTMTVGHLFVLETVGAFTLALTTAQILYIAALFGTNDLQMTDYGERVSFGTYGIFRCTSMAAACFLSIITVKLLRFGPAAKQYTMLLVFFMVLNAFAELFQSQFFRRDRLDLCGKSLFFRYLLSTAGFAAVLAAGGTISSACLMMIILNLAATWRWDFRIAGSFGAGFEEWTGEKNKEGRKEKNRAVILKQLAFEALPLAASALGYQVIINGPRYMISYFLDEGTQGVYHLLFLPAYVLNLISQFLFKPYLHRYAETMDSDRKAFVKMLRRHLAGLTAGSFLIAGSMYVIGPEVISLFFGQNMRAYRSWQALFAFAGGVLAVNQLFYYLEVIRRRQKIIFLIYLAGGAAMLLTGIVLIPRMAISGAWISFAAGQGTILAGFLLSWLNRTRKQSA